MPYRTSEEWTDMIMSHQLNIADLNQFGQVGNFETLRSHIANNNRDGVLAWVREDLNKPLTRDKDGLNAMHIASLKGKIEVLRYLIDKGGDPNSTTDGGYTPLGNAWRGNSAEACSVLLESGGNVNSNSNIGFKTIKPLILEILDSARSDCYEERESASFFLKAICKNTRVKLGIPSDYISRFVSSIMRDPTGSLKAYYDPEETTTFQYIEEIIRLVEGSFDASTLRKDVLQNYVTTKSTEYSVGDLKMLDLSFYFKNLQKVSEGDIFISNENLRKFLKNYQGKKIQESTSKLPIQKVKISSLNPSCVCDESKLSFEDLKLHNLNSELFIEMLGLLRDEVDVLGSVANHLPCDAHESLEAAGGGGMEAKEL